MCARASANRSPQIEWVRGFVGIWQRTAFKLFDYVLHLLANWHPITAIQYSISTIRSRVFIFSSIAPAITAWIKCIRHILLSTQQLGLFYLVSSSWTSVSHNLHRDTLLFRCIFFLHIAVEQMLRVYFNYFAFSCWSFLPLHILMATQNCSRYL